VIYEKREGYQATDYLYRKILIIVSLLKSFYQTPVAFQIMTTDEVYNLSAKKLFIYGRNIFFFLKTLMLFFSLP